MKKFEFTGETKSVLGMTLLNEDNTENCDAKGCMYNDGGYCRSCGDLRNNELDEDCVDYTPDDIEEADK